MSLFQILCSYFTFFLQECRHKLDTILQHCFSGCYRQIGLESRFFLNCFLNICFYCSCVQDLLILYLLLSAVPWVTQQQQVTQKQHKAPLFKLALPIFQNGAGIQEIQPCFFFPSVLSHQIIFVVVLLLFLICGFRQLKERTLSKPKYFPYENKDIHSSSSLSF